MYLLVGDDGSSHFIHAQIELLIADANTQGEGRGGEGGTLGAVFGGYLIRNRPTNCSNSQST